VRRTSKPSACGHHDRLIDSSIRIQPAIREIQQLSSCSWFVLIIRLRTVAHWPCRHECTPIAAVAAAAAAATTHKNHTMPFLEALAVLALASSLIGWDVHTIADAESTQRRERLTSGESQRHSKRAAAAAYKKRHQPSAAECSKHTMKTLTKSLSSYL
jgi:hypothetical protein